MTGSDPVKKNYVRCSGLDREFVQRKPTIFWLSFSCCLMLIWKIQNDAKNV